MKKTLLAIACGLALTLSAANADALILDLDSATFIGSVDPGSPASADAEVVYINYLIGMTPSTSEDDVDLPPPPAPFAGVDAYDFVRDDFDCTGVCDPATTTGAGGGDPLDPISDGFTYLLAKYGNTSYVWYVAGLTDLELNQTLGGNGLSHYSLFNPGTVTTPDGGATLGLLGLAMLGVGYLRRRMA